ncbi:iron ABC transporter ATP-binding protein [Agromyces aerolatus]|uniref:iron ABC transporter ATP-binding protein n=1 Tax=Agromyces sp. LY-1074 TaxID=3074080 RepID=UPI0028556429|nr:MULTISPECIES: ATP-binding cassette domain-containing protein [unclassified Agromyces]MDR5700872.1 ATP-binding cassette domain-containing protein [Agromyces sp. LY-1074]MDR5707467.1 ATP-binding cassette domain-containing protein [Agromyces sp. LY-1358]
MITLHQVAKKYGSTDALGPIDLEIAPGGITALVGPNGAGKSTMLTIIGRLLGADSGTVRIGDFDVVTSRPRELAKVVSILKQENHFVARLTVRQLVGFGRFPHSRGRLTAEDHDAVERAIGFLDLGGLEERFLDELSGGQRQRAFVAMVLAQDTDYVLLDEPLASLDMRHASAMMQRLRDAADSLGRTIVLVVHDLNFAAAYADRIVALSGGRIAAAGTPEEIMRPEVLSEVFETPVEVIEHRGRRLAVYYRV